MSRFEARLVGGTYDLFDTERDTTFIGGVGRDKDRADKLAEVANRLGDEAYDENVWTANALEDPVRAMGKTEEYWAQFKR